MWTLVTGGAGFIGTHLIKAILAEAPLTRIVSLDDYSTGTKANHIEGVQYIEGSTLDAIKLLARFEISTIYHFGEFSRIYQSYHEIDKVQASCQEGTSQIIRLAIKHNATLIYSASSSHLGQKVEELSPYSYLKKQNVELIKRHQEWSKLKFHIFYFFNAYGPGQIEEGPYATVLGIWQSQIEKGEPITVVEPGTQARYWTRVEAIAQACAQHGHLLPGGEWALYSEDKMTLIQIVQKLKKKTKWIEARPGDRTRIPTIKFQKPPYWKHPYRLEDWLGDLRRWTKPQTPSDWEIE